MKCSLCMESIICYVKEFVTQGCFCKKQLQVLQWKIIVQLKIIIAVEIFFCLFVWFDSLCPSQQFFSYVRTGLPRLNLVSTKQG